MKRRWRSLRIIICLLILFISVGNFYQMSAYSGTKGVISIENAPQNKLILEPGDSIRLKAQTSNKNTITYKSGNKKIVSINKKGKITAVKEGSTNITLKAKNTKSQIIKIVVKKKNSTKDKTDNSSSKEITTQESNSITETKEDKEITLNIKIGSTSFKAKMFDHSTTQAFIKELPMTINMGELNGNEKYFYLPQNLPTDSQNVGSIRNGDLMLYGSDCIVLFYKDFQTPYSYTRLGYIEDTSKLEEVLGTGSVEITFEVSR